MIASRPGNGCPYRSCNGNASAPASVMIPRMPDHAITNTDVAGGHPSRRAMTGKTTRVPYVTTYTQTSRTTITIALISIPIQIIRNANDGSWTISRTCSPINKNTSPLRRKISRFQTEYATNRASGVNSWLDLRLT